MRKVGLILIFLLLSAPISVAAAGAQIGEQCTVGADQTITGNLHALCQSVVIDGTVKGDVVAVAWSVTINGTVEGEIVAIAGQLVINGSVGGDMRTLAGRLLVAPGARLTAGHADVAGIGLSAEVMAPVFGDFLYVGYQGIIASTIGGDVQFNGAALVIDGPVAGSAEVTINRPPIQPPDIPALGLAFRPPGFVLGVGTVDYPRIRGQLHYQAPESLAIEPGMVGGDVQFTPGPSEARIGVSPVSEVVGGYIGRILRDLLALMLVGLIVLFVAQNGLMASAWRLKVRTASAFGYGLAALLLFVPAALLLLLVSLTILVLVHLVTLGELTLMTTVLLLMVNLVFVGGACFVMIFLARLAVCYVIGQWLGRRLFIASDRATTLVISLLLGVLAYAVVSELGAIGLLLNLLAICFGTGAIILYVRDTWILRQAPLPVHPLNVSPIALLLPGTITPGDLPVPPGDVEAMPGMDNLPEGFTWFDN